MFLVNMPGILPPSPSWVPPPSLSRYVLHFFQLGQHCSFIVVDTPVCFYSWFFLLWPGNIVLPLQQDTCTSVYDPFIITPFHASSPLKSVCLANIWWPCQCSCHLKALIPYCKVVGVQKCIQLWNPYQNWPLSCLWNVKRIKSTLLSGGC